MPRPSRSATGARLGHGFALRARSQRTKRLTADRRMPPVPPVLRAHNGKTPGRAAPCLFRNGDPAEKGAETLPAGSHPPEAASPVRPRWEGAPSAGSSCKPSQLFGR